MHAQQVLSFWFEELSEQGWFKKDEHIDQLIAQRFSELHQQAIQGELYQWRVTPQGRLAEIIILDQFSRNIFRDTAQAFAADGQALCLAQEMVCAGLDVELSKQQRLFAYMPYMHSESLLVQDESLRLYAELDLEKNLQFAKRHQEIIAQFGRYPHRNEILGRISSAEEIAFLNSKNSSF